MTVERCKTIQTYHTIYTCTNSDS